MTAEELVDDADERLFSKVRYCAYHVLEELLPPKSDSQHNLRKRRHNITLPEKKGHLAANNFIIDCCTKTPTDFITGILITFFLVFNVRDVFLMWFSLCFSVILLRSVSCVFTIKTGLDWITPCSVLTYE